MRSLNIVWLALSAITISVADDQPRLWSWNQNTEPTQQIQQQYQIESNGAESSSGADSNNQTEADLEEVIDTILASNRQGRNLDGFDEVYSDPTVQDALQKGDDTQARNLIKEKLCTLGLMQCDGEQSVEGKRPFLPPGGLIYAQPPNGPYRGPPLRPPPGTKIMYGPPRPMPPGIVSKFGPPRKVGYASGPVYNGPPYLNSPPPNFQGPIYHGKPPGHILDSGSPYKFDSGKETIISNEEYQALQLGSGLSESSVPSKTIHNDGITGSGSSSVNIHHHYHHIDGQAANAKAPAVVVNNPIPVPVPISVNNGNGLVTGEFSSVNHHTNGVFNPLNSGYEHQSFKQSGFNGLNSGLNNGISPGDIYGAGAKPVFESANYDSGSNFGPSSFGGTGLGSSGPGGINGFGQQGALGNYGSGANSYHSSNPDYYKKALKGNLNINSVNSQLGSGFGGLYGNGQNYQGLESARQDNFDCVCVPYDQCPARDVLGRKGDLILPLDPRNLGSDIEALADVTHNESISNATGVTKEASKGKEEDKTKKLSKREAAENKSDESAKAEGEAVSLVCF